MDPRPHPHGHLKPASAQRSESVARRPGRSVSDGQRRSRRRALGPLRPINRQKPLQHCVREPDGQISDSHGLSWPVSDGHGNFEPRPTIDGHAVSRASTASVSICAAGQSHADHATDAHVGRRCVGRQIGPAIYSAGTFVPSTWIASSHVEGLSLHVTRGRQDQRHKRSAVCALRLSDRLPRRGTRRCQAAPSAPRRLADCLALLAIGANVQVPPHGRPFPCSRAPQPALTPDALSSVPAPGLL